MPVIDNFTLYSGRYSVIYNTTSRTCANLFHITLELCELTQKKEHQLSHELAIPYIQVLAREYGLTFDWAIQDSDIDDDKDDIDRQMDD